MTEMNFIKVPQPEAVPITTELDLTDAAVALLSPGMSPAQYLQCLIDNALYADAIMFLAASLPTREATWWACLCARSTLTEQSPAPDIKATALAEAWVYKPTPENCSVTLAAAEATGFKTPAGWAAMAAFWSGDNISPNKEAIVPPPNGLTGKAVNGAVMLAAVQGEPARIAEYQQLFLKKGIDIACGGDGRLADRG